MAFDFSNEEDRIDYLDKYEYTYTQMYEDIYSNLNNAYANTKFNIISIGAGAGLDYIAAESIFGKGNFTWKGIDNQDWSNQLRINRDFMLFQDFFEIKLHDFGKNEKEDINILFFTYSYRNICYCDNWGNIPKKIIEIYKNILLFCKNYSNTVVVIIDKEAKPFSEPNYDFVGIINHFIKLGFKPIGKKPICKKYDLLDGNPCYCNDMFCSCLPNDNPFISLLKYEPNQ